VKGKAGGGLEFYAGSNALRLALGTTSYLHGSWVAANAQFTASDAGLKKNIVPLYKSLSKLQQARRIAASSDGDVLQNMDKAIRSNDHLLSEDKSFNKQYNTTMMSADAIRASQMGDQASKYATDLQDATALFKELRPVSYVMKEKGQVEAKNLRFGFIAQEVEALLPSLVHTDETDGKKALMYNDLIAVVIMTLQQELSVVEGLKLKVDEHDSKLTTVDERIAMLETEIMALREALLQKKLIDAQPEGQSLLSKATASSDIEITQAAVTANQGSQQRRSKEPQLPVGRKQEQEIAAADIPTIMA
jgi:dynactin complex subunit